MAGITALSSVPAYAAEVYGAARGKPIILQSDITDTIASAEKLGILNENNDITSIVTKKEFSRLMVRFYRAATGATGITLSNSPFVDCDANEVIFCAENGIINGLSNVTFAPENYVTREEACTYLVTNDWLYFDLKTGHRYNVLNPNQSVIAFIDGKPIEEYFHYKGTAKLVKYWSEGVQKNIFEDAERDENGDTIFTKNSATGKLTYKTVKRQANSILVMENKEDDPNTMAYPATEWDLAFNGYQLRTNSGTSGLGKGGAADLGYGEYDKWTSKAQVDAYLAEHNMTFAVDDSASVYVTMSQNDWNKYCIANKLDMKENPWFDPNNGPAKQLVSGNPVLEKAMSFSGPPPVYTPSFHTYVIRSWDGERYYKLQIISWYDANVQIGDEGGRISYYLDELK